LAEALLPVTAAKRQITVIAANHYLFALLQHLAAVIEAGNHGCFAAAMADGFNFLDVISPGQKGGTSGK
jgi:hypothetical protein